MPHEPISIEDNLSQLCDLFLQNLTDPLTIVDRDYRIFWANRSKAGEHGLRQEDIIGKICYEILFGNKKPCTQCLVSQVKLSGRPLKIEKKCQLPRGRSAWCEQRTVPIGDKNGRIAYIMVYGIIITDRVILEKKQDDHIKNLEKMIGVIQHDDSSTDEAGNGRNPAGLTNREVEVLHLMAKGRTNPEISQTLSISKHTAKSHVINIFNKLGVNNRTQAAVMGTFHQLFYPLEQ